MRRHRQQRACTAVERRHRSGWEHTVGWPPSCRHSCSVSSDGSTTSTPLSATVMVEPSAGTGFTGPTLTTVSFDESERTRRSSRRDSTGSGPTTRTHQQTRGHVHTYRSTTAPWVRCSPSSCRPRCPATPSPREECPPPAPPQNRHQRRQHRSQPRAPQRHRRRRRRYRRRRRQRPPPQSPSVPPTAGA